MRAINKHLRLIILLVLILGTICSCCYIYANSENVHQNFILTKSTSETVNEVSIDEYGVVHNHDEGENSAHSH